MSARARALLYRFCLFFVVGFLLGIAPVIQKLSDTGADVSLRSLLVALLLAGLSGAIAFLEKYFAPQLMAVLADPGDTGPVLPTVGIPLKDVTPTPPEVTPSSDPPVA